MTNLQLTIILTWPILSVLLIFLFSLTWKFTRSNSNSKSNKTILNPYANQFDEAGNPIFICGSLWENGEKVGFSHCENLALHFYVSFSTLSSVTVKCGSCNKRSPRFDVPFVWREIDKEEATSIVLTQRIFS
jgi:hypothetical protein